MTPDERNLLGRFLQELNQNRRIEKDAEADNMISQAVGSNPDATYLLVQHSLLADQALRVSQGRIAELEEQLRSRGQQSSYTGSGGSFLGGNAQPGGPWGAQRPQQAPSGPGGYGAGYGGGYAQPDNYPPQPAAPSGSRFGGFFQNAAATAAGVAGGQFLFQGLSNVFGGGHGGLGGFGGGFGGAGFGGERPNVENVTINEYGDQSRLPDSDQQITDAGYQDSSFDDVDFSDGDGGFDDGDSYA